MRRPFHPWAAASAGRNRNSKRLACRSTQRGALTNEYLEAIRTFWSNDVATYEGRFVSFKDVLHRPAAGTLRPDHRYGWAVPAKRRSVAPCCYGDAWHPYTAFSVDALRDKALAKACGKSPRPKGKPVPALCPRLTLRLTTSPLSESSFGWPDMERLIRFAQTSRRWPTSWNGVHPI